MSRKPRAVLAAHLLVLAALTGCSSDSEGPPTDIRSYVALGDSYSAAPGVPDTEVESGCTRSTGSYPARIAKRLATESYVDAACGGAATRNMLEGQRTARGEVAPQFDALNAKVDLVTVGIGANDGIFAGIFTDCLRLAAEDPEGAPCRRAMATPEGGDRLTEVIGELTERLGSTLSGIEDRAPDAEVVLVGYPQIVPARGTCAGLPLARGDYDYVRSLMVELGRVMEDAADAAGVRYVDLLGPSEGHDICAGDQAWVNGTVSDERAMGLHPFAEEQAAVADLVVSGL